MIDQATIGLLMKGVNAVTWQSLVMIGVSFVLFYLAIAKDYEEQKDAAAAESDRIIADLRAGNLRLRQLWQAQAATADLSQAVARAAQPDEGARDREESAAAIVRAADECDAQVRGLQQVIEADRRE